MLQHSAFSQGILDAKLDITTNPFKEEPQKTWWQEGFDGASDSHYATPKGILLKDKPVYENIPETI